jgi:hypothetical protein
LGFQGDFIPVLDRHTGSRDIADLVTDGIDQIQQQFDPLRKQIDRRQYTPPSDINTRLPIYWAVVEGKIIMTMELMKPIHKNRFNDDRFPESRIWRLVGAFASALKEREPQRKSASALGVLRLLNYAERRQIAVPAAAQLAEHP